MFKTRFTLATTAFVAVAVALTGCSTNDNSGTMSGVEHGGSGSTATAAPTAQGSPHNDADVTFAMGMLPHHKQAVEMADMILAKDGIDSEIRSLAQDIKAAQTPEIDTLNGWLTAWGAPTAMAGMDHGTGDGMMSEGDMAALEAADGVDATRLFLEQMIQHHQGAVEMAETEVANGENPDAITLAKNIVKDQKAEIADMSARLKNL